MIKSLIFAFFGIALVLAVPLPQESSAPAAAELDVQKNFPPKNEGQYEVPNTELSLESKTVAEATEPNVEVTEVTGETAEPEETPVNENQNNGNSSPAVVEEEPSQSTGVPEEPDYDSSSPAVFDNPSTEEPNYGGSSPAVTEEEPYYPSTGIPEEHVTENNNTPVVTEEEPQVPTIVPSHTEEPTYEGSSPAVTEEEPYPSTSLPQHQTEASTESNETLAPTTKKTTEVSKGTKKPALPPKKFKPIDPDFINKLLQWFEEQRREARKQMEADYKEFDKILKAIELKINGPFGHNHGPFGHNHGPFGHNHGPFGHNRGPYGRRPGSYGPIGGPYGPRLSPYGPDLVLYGPNGRPYGRQPGPFDDLLLPGPVIITN